MPVASRQRLLAEVAPERPAPGGAFRDLVDTVFHELDRRPVPRRTAPTPAPAAAPVTATIAVAGEGVWSVAAEPIGRDAFVQLLPDGAHLAQPDRHLPPAGFAAASVQAGEPLCVRQAGESSPLTVPFPEGTVLYLGAHGLPVATPPAGMSCQVGIATRAGFLYQPGPAILPEGA